jgi:hypothetical protein
MVEIFGGIFALLLVLFLLMNLLSQAALAERLEAAAEEGLYRVGWGANGAGFVVLTFARELRIVENGETVAAGPDGDLCHPSSPFVRYVRRIYQGERQQIIFAILQDGVGTMAEARNCIMRVLPAERPVTVGWIIANDELLKSVSLGDIPAHVRQATLPAVLPGQTP